MQKSGLSAWRALEKKSWTQAIWLSGQESWKKRHAVQCIRTFQVQALPQSSSIVIEEERLLASEDKHAFESVMEHIQMPSLFTPYKRIILEGAESFKLDLHWEPIVKALKGQDQVSLIVLSDKLDLRKKALASFVTSHFDFCSFEPVHENDRLEWIQYLSHHVAASMTVPDSKMDTTSDDASTRVHSPSKRFLESLEPLEPWSLDLVENLLRRQYLIEGEDDGLPGDSSYQVFKLDEVSELIFEKNLSPLLGWLPYLAHHPEDALPFLGFLGWLIRHFWLFLSGVTPRVGGQWSSRFQSWQKTWTKEALFILEKSTLELDLELKRSQRSALGLWMEWALKVSKA